MGNREAMIAKLGSEEAYRDWMRAKGAKGGKSRSPEKGFGSNRNLASHFGKTTRRGPNVNNSSTTNGSDQTNKNS